jgi:DNA processing protein
MHDHRYPEQLKELEYPPQVLYAAGALDTLTTPCVAIVGTRTGSQSGERIAHALAYALASAGVCVVSGLAKGIDSAAHRGALAASGKTCAVLGTGLNLTYPVEHISLQRKIGEVGLLLTEMPPGQRPHKGSFPKRNRIIAALADVTIVVEAGVGSGAIKTSEFAADLGRVVGAVPGNIEWACCAESNKLLREGAQVIATVQDALQLVGVSRPAPAAPTREMSAVETAVLRALGERSLSTEQLVVDSGLPLTLCLAAISSLELDQVIEADLAGLFRARMRLSAGLFHAGA